MNLRNFSFIGFKSVLSVLALLSSLVLASGSDANLNGCRIVVCGNSMIYYGGMVRYGEQCGEDDGMLYKMLQSKGYSDFCVYDCTYGGHHLCDFSSKGCVFSEKHGSDPSEQKASGGCPGTGQDLLEGIPLESVDYVFISEAGNDYPHFYSDARTLFERFRSVNPNVKLYYINHIYSVYKKHENVLGSLKALHDSLGVTIINCGQLAYDIYTGVVEVPGGKLSYTDRHTFCNHLEKDGHHPNPLMGYIMSSMAVCALTGQAAVGEDWKYFVLSCLYASGSVPYSSYYEKYYAVPASPSFMSVIDSETEMKGIQQLIPTYINKF